MARFTAVASHALPRGVVRPRAFSPAASWRSDAAPAARNSSISGAIRHAARAAFRRLPAVAKAASGVW